MQLLLIPKEDPERSIWLTNMGHDKDSLTSGDLIRCYTRHIDTSAPRRLWRPVKGLLNVVTRPTVSRDVASVAQRKALHQEKLRQNRRKALEKQVVDKMKTHPEEMSEKYIDTQNRVFTLSKTKSAHSTRS